jgi:signal recognition particle receptor subunit beta
VSSINLFTREISIKIVYYGPGLGGKTSSLQYIHRALKPDSKGQLVSLATGADRTLYFDFLPVKLPKLRGYAIRVQLYTVPGQVHYNSTRKLVLAGADGVVFVADSQAERAAANVESLENLRENLAEQGLRLDQVPHAIQLNKRDVPQLSPVEEMTAQLNQHRAPVFETVATSGRGVFEALKSITTLVLTDLRRRGLWDGGREGAAIKPAPAIGKDTSAEGITQKLQALSDAQDALAKLEPAEVKPQRETSGVSPLPVRTRAASGPALSELLPQGPMREAAVGVEVELERGDYAHAVRIAARAFAETVPAGDEGPALRALLLGLPGERYVRFRETARRAEAGAASSADAMFALFFLVDAALRR